MITRLNDTDIKSGKKRQADDRWTVEVQREDLSAALREMQKLRLIREVAPGAGDGTSVVSTRDQQRFAFERALSAEIEQTLSSIEGVLEARTHLNLPQVDPLFGKTIPGARGSGSVFLVTERSFAFDRDNIAALVSGASGIPAEQVSVLIEVPSTRLSERAELLPSASSLATPHLETSDDVAAPELPELTFGAAQIKRFLPLVMGVLLAAMGLWLLKRVVLSKSIRI